MTVTLTDSGAGDLAEALSGAKTGQTVIINGIEVTSTERYRVFAEMDDIIFYARKQDTVDRLIDGLKKMSRGEYILTGYGADMNEPEDIE